jgi:hypothetical protein
MLHCLNLSGTLKVFTVSVFVVFNAHISYKQNLEVCVRSISIVHHLLLSYKTASGFKVFGVLLYILFKITLKRLYIGWGTIHSSF